MDSPIRFLWPWLAGLVFLTIGPLVGSFLLSMTSWDGASFSTLEWVGLENYRELVRVDSVAEGGNALASSGLWYGSILGGEPADPLFYRSLYNSLYVTLFAVPLGLVAALLMAVLLNAPLRGMGFFRTVFYLPHVLGGVATVLVWSWVFNPRFGPVNTLLSWCAVTGDPLVRLVYAGGSAHWSPPHWLMSQAWCKPAIVIMHVWTAGGAVFIFLAALQRVSTDCQEAAMLDGASRWRRFWRITFPLLTPAILFNLVTGMAGSLQAFNQAYLLYNRSQDDGLLFYMLRLYRIAFESPHRLGYASAMAWIMFVLLVTLAVIAVASGRKWVHYES